MIQQEHPRRMVAGAMLSVSEGGFGLETTARIEQGEPIRLRIPAHGNLRELELEAIVWYEGPALRARGGREQRLLGCVLPDRSPEFLDLFAEVERRHAPPERLRPMRTAGARRPGPRDVEVRVEAPVDADLPRSRDPLPPPKPEPEESQPSFRVRLRQIGGPRTRVVSVQACSITQAAERVRSQLAEADGAERWAVLEVTPGADASRRNP